MIGEVIISTNMYNFQEDPHSIALSLDVYFVATSSLLILFEIMWA